MRTRLPFFLSCLVLLAGCLASFSVRADDSYSPGSHKMPLSTPADVAMTYYKFSGQLPDFDAWAQLSDEYKKADDYDKLTTREKKAKELEQTFALLSPSDQLVIEYPVELSEYSLANKGYLIENFKDALFFPFSYAGKDFAVVPKNIMDRQWVAADGYPAKEIDDIRQASPNKKEARLTLILWPRFADKATVAIDGKNYHPIAADVVGMVFFNAKGLMVWRQKTETETPEQKKRREELMRLYH